MKIVKFSKLCALLLSFVLLAGLLAACGEKDEDKDEQPAGQNGGNPAVVDENFVGVNFSNGNIGFLAMNYREPDSSPDARIELSEFKGAPAAKITPFATATPYIAIDACSLLGDRIGDVASVEIMLGVETPGGFQAIQGEIIARVGEDRSTLKDSWSVFIDTRNPNAVRMELGEDEQMVSGAYNMFIIRRTLDNSIESVMTAAEAIENEGRQLIAQGNALIEEGEEEGDADKIAEGEALIAQAPAKFDQSAVKAAEADRAAGAMFITSIAFFDRSGNPLPVNADAVFNAPEGFNEASLRIHELGPFQINPTAAEGGAFFHNGWLTDGVDNKESPHTALDFANAFQLVLELAEPIDTEDERLQLVWHGSTNGWAWAQNDDIFPVTGGTGGATELVINLETSLVNYSDFAASGEDDSLKLYIGFNDTPCDLNIVRAYLVISEE